ncbi:MAG TPA: N-glycosylase/DNA lyase [Nitrospiria bacterium]|jgi:N-glycosylase/DNA lyase|nr:N-glycosylase/DNA lyase [Nitrospiria bacterium]
MRKRRRKGKLNPTRKKTVARPSPAATLEALKDDYRWKRGEVQSRLNEFQQIFKKGDAAIFKELCFCIAAANSSAEMGMKTVDAIQDIVLEADLATLQDRLRHGFRYKRKRPSYIVHTRDYLKKEHDFKLGRLLQSFSDPDARRDFLVFNRDIKGIGFKEASHFLRNIGYRGYAILDKHILNCLAELGVIRRNRKPLNPRRYRRIERKMRAFADRIGIDMDELDLLLWSRKTGKILK